MYKKNLIKKIRLFRYFDQKQIGSIPRIFISSFLLIFFFYSTPLILNFASNDNEFQNNSKAVLAYTLNNGSNKTETLNEKDFSPLHGELLSFNYGRGANQSFW